MQPERLDTSYRSLENGSVTKLVLFRKVGNSKNIINEDSFIRDISFLLYMQKDTSFLLQTHTEVTNKIVNVILSMYTTGIQCWVSLK